MPRKHAYSPWVDVIASEYLLPSLASLRGSTASSVHLGDGCAGHGACRRWRSSGCLDITNICKQDRKGKCRSTGEQDHLSEIQMAKA